MLPPKAKPGPDIECAATICDARYWLRLPYTMAGTALGHHTRWLAMLLPGGQARHLHHHQRSARLLPYALAMPCPVAVKLLNKRLPTFSHATLHRWYEGLASGTTTSTFGGIGGGLPGTSVLYRAGWGSRRREDGFRGGVLPGWYGLCPVLK
eukprot:3426852-Rhodomonas_salina.9